MTQTPSLTKYAWLSIAAAVATIALKGAAYFLTGSVGLLSDALESTINLAAAIVALAALRLAERPPDDEFSFGYSKVEYFASGFEGGMIILAAAGIVISAAPRLFAPAPLEQLGLGLAISLLASGVNLAVGLILLRAARRAKSITLEADARHLLTDVWTTAGVLVGIAVVGLTGWLRLDPLIAMLVALNIVVTGYRLLARAWRGLMDAALPPAELAQVRGILTELQPQGVSYHALRSRQAAARKFLVVHLLVPGDWTIQAGHAIADAFERRVRAALPEASIVTHIEPAGEAISMEDEEV